MVYHLRPRANPSMVARLSTGEVLVCGELMQGVNVWKCVVKLMYGDVTNYI